MPRRVQSMAQEFFQQYKATWQRRNRHVADHRLGLLIAQWADPTMARSRPSMPRPELRMALTGDDQPMPRHHRELGGVRQVVTETSRISSALRQLPGTCSGRFRSPRITPEHSDSLLYRIL